MTILDKFHIATPDLADALKQVEEFIAKGWKVGYEMQDYPMLNGWTYVIVMVLEGEEEVVKEVPVAAPKATPAKAVSKKAV